MRQNLALTHIGSVVKPRVYDLTKLILALAYVCVL